MKLLLGNALEQLKTIPDNSVHCCITSPPYWNLRDYGTDPVLWPEVTFIPMAGLLPVTVPEMVCNHGLEPDVLSKYNGSFSAAVNGLVSKRNIRSVWTITTQGFKEAHFATFPEKLVEPCIKAGTSEKGCCPECGAPWVRITEKTKSIPRKVSSSHAAVPGQKLHSVFITERHDEPAEVVTIGWQPSCKHDLKPIPCTVLDIFTGSGTTGVVANKLNRNFVGIEINPEYLTMAERRIYEVAPLFAECL